MMINKRLIGAVPESKQYIAGNVIVQRASLIANVCMMGAVASLLQRLGASYSEKVRTSEVVRWRWRALTSWRPTSARTCPSSSMLCWLR